jgi:hypothetical protein
MRVLRFLLAYAILLTVWVFSGQPLYDHLLAAEVNGAFRPLVPAGIELHAEAAEGVLLVECCGSEQLPTMRGRLSTVHNNVPLLLALLFASPIPINPFRLRALVIAFGLLVVSHFVFVFSTVHWYLAAKNVSIYHSDSPVFPVGLGLAISEPPLRPKFLAGAVYFFLASPLRFALPVVIWLFMVDLKSIRREVPNGPSLPP